MTTPRIYSLLEVAERLRIPMSTARRLAHENAFPGCIRLGKRTFRYRAEIIDRWLSADPDHEGEGQADA